MQETGLSAGPNTLAHPYLISLKKTTHTTIRNLTRSSQRQSFPGRGIPWLPSLVRFGAQHVGFGVISGCLWCLNC